jgi:hypothetical protein
VCVDLGYRIQHFLALGGLVSNQEITSHWCERALAWLPVKSKLLRIDPGGDWGRVLDSQSTHVSGVALVQPIATKYMTREAQADSGDLPMWCR